MLNYNDVKNLTNHLHAIKSNINSAIDIEYTKTISDLKDKIVDAIKSNMMNSLTYNIRYDYNIVKAKDFANLVSEFLNNGILIERTNIMVTEECDVGMFDSNTVTYEHKCIRITIIV